MNADAWKHDDPVSELHERSGPALALASDTRLVLLHLIGGEQIEIGSVHGREAALTLARETAASVDSATELGTWPEFGERFVRPGAIVSVDVRRQ